MAKGGVLNEYWFMSRIYGGIAAALIVSIVIPTIAGNVLYRLKHKSGSAKPVHQPFRAVYIFLILPNLACIPLFLDLKLFYAVLSNYNLIVVAMWAFPITTFCWKIKAIYLAQWKYGIFQRWLRRFHVWFCGWVHWKVQVLFSYGSFWH